MSKITIDRDLLEQALEALAYYEYRRIEWDYKDDQAIDALRTALEQPQVEQKPVAWLREDGKLALNDGGMFSDNWKPLYTHPQNLNCKSTQARLATLWGYEKAGQPKEIVAYEYVERRPYGAPGEIRRSTILLEHYRNADGTIAGDWDWLIEQFKNAKTTISLRPLYPGPYIVEQEKKNG